eukprot:TRINITY_DN979_c0_g1_i1.p1 TRINITY_DN979_c0_g1~~TRINITY_DN979_c0_g1_i1.p1  ORF type:complete len:325 (+),score=94.59 TRINITY_DN979_c0_g1_i1:50-976(+)
MATITEETIEHDGWKLFCKTFKPETRAPVATVTFVHGLGEHCGRYDEIFKRFASESGLVVNTFDHRGHGKSSGPRGHIPSQKAAFSDITLMARKASVDIPHFLYGHSMGGGMVLGWGLEQKNLGNPVPVKGYITTAPFLNIPKPPSGFLVAIVKFIAMLFPSFAINNGLDVENLSRDKSEVEKYKNDPLVHPKVSVIQAVTGFKNGDEVLRNAAKFDAPILIMQGDADTCVCPKSPQKFFEACGSSDKTLELYPGWYHELHNEPKEDREKVIKTIQEWIQNHCDHKPPVTINVNEGESKIVSTNEETV